MKKWTILFVVAIMPNVFGSAGDTDDTLDGCGVDQARTQDPQGWLPPHLTQEQKEVLWALLQKRQSSVSMPYEVAGNMRYPGLNEGLMTAFTVRGLAHVRTLAGTLGVKPDVLDIGSGDGYHAALFALAGAHVSLVENDACLLQPLITILDRLKKSIIERTLDTLLTQFLPQGDGIGDWTRLLKEDATTLLEREEHLGAYDFVNAANVLHTMNPTQAVQCVKGLYGALKPGGAVHVRVHTLQGARSVTRHRFFDLYADNLGKGSAFPGWVGFKENAGFFGRVAGFGAFRAGPQSAVIALDEGAPVSPMEVIEGRSETTHGFFRMRQHNFFLFDVATLKGLFEGAGFESVACYFEMKDGALKDVQPGQEIFKDTGNAHELGDLEKTYGATHICYIAKKPTH